MDTNTDNSVRLIAEVRTTTGTVNLQGHLTAMYVPFGSTGGSTLSLGDEPAALDGLGQ